MKFDIVLDLQLGSTGKGLLCGHLADSGQYDGAVCAWGPNSGHTCVWDDHRVIVTMVPISAFSDHGPSNIFVAPGASLDVAALLREAEALASIRRYPVEIWVHPHAAVVDESCREAEKSYAFKIGSTQKGTGEAVIRKLRRDVSAGPAVAQDHKGEIDSNFGFVSVRVTTASDWQTRIERCHRVLAEGSQGYSLGINSGFWPHATSRECSTAQIISDCHLPLGSLNRVYGVCRTFPIRVADRFKDGVRVGTSGPVYPDQLEITWEQVGVPPELTTVTQLQRRVFTFSVAQYVEACRINRVDEVFLNFANYLAPRPAAALRLANLWAEHSWGAAPISLLGFGPRVDHVVTADGAKWNSELVVAKLEEAEAMGHTFFASNDAARIAAPFEVGSSSKTGGAA